MKFDPVCETFTIVDVMTVVGGQLGMASYIVIIIIIINI